MTYATVRKVGNSLGIVIPKAEAERQHLKEGDRVDVQLRKAASMASIAGILKGKLGDWERLLQEMDAEDEE